MSQSKYLVKSLIPFLVFILATESMRYEIEDEAMKLYGEDLNSVIKRFRRTPYYLKILNEKLEEVKADYMIQTFQIIYTYENKKLRQKVKEIMCPNGNEETPQPEVRANSLKQKPLFTIDKTYGFRQGLRQHEHSKEIHDEKHAIKTLDAYEAFDSPLTLQEKNMFKELGFEYAGRIIHEIIKSMGSEDADLMMSTRLPADRYKTDMTVTPHDHEVGDGWIKWPGEVVISTRHHPPSSTPDQPPPEAIYGRTANSYLYRQRAPKAKIQQGS